MREFGPCLCGDTHCPSCGPAQGVFRCEICGVWSDEGTCADPEACAKASREMADAEAKALEEEQEMFDKLSDQELKEYGFHNELHKRRRKKKLQEGAE